MTDYDVPAEWVLATRNNGYGYGYGSSYGYGYGHGYGSGHGYGYGSGSGSGYGYGYGYGSIPREPRDEWAQQRTDLYLVLIGENDRWKTDIACSSSITDSSTSATPSAV